MVIRPAIEKHLLQKDQKKEIKPTALWVSDIGYCPRKAMHRVLGFQPEREFPVELLEKFEYGKIYEELTGRALKAEFGTDLVEQFRLETEIWHGNIDFLVSKPSPLLIEHKATSDSGFNYIPKEEHLAQLVLYGQLFEELYHKSYQLVLVYRSWSHYAEFYVVDLGDKIQVDGEIDRKPIKGDFWFNVTKRRQVLEKWFNLQQLPTDYTKSDECEWQGRKNCNYFDACHSVKPGDF